ncbi:MAG TPA: nitroreductase family protein [Kineosporiaceae bacterium]
MTVAADSLHAPAGGHQATATPQLTQEEITAIGEAARWAPSIHNSQPWRFRRLPDGIAVREDLSRSLPVIDPAGRDRLVSCGSAVLNARVALRALGYLPDVALLPDPADPTLIATIRAVGRRPPAEGDALLQQMIPLRHTHRRVYRSHVVAEEDLLQLRQAASAEGARLSVADSTARRRLAGLLRRAVRAQAADDQLRDEVERWVRRGGHDHVDGIPSSALGTSPFPVDSLVHGGHRGTPEAHDVEEELARSTVLVVSTRADSRHDWVVAGLALERLLLTATAKGLVATFTDQPLQDPSVRPEVAEALAIWGQPQVLLRIGRALVEAPATPRRPLEELLS